MKEIGVFGLIEGATGAVEDENGSKMKIDTGWVSAYLLEVMNSSLSKLQKVD